MVSVRAWVRVLMLTMNGWARVMTDTATDAFLLRWGRDALAVKWLVLVWAEAMLGYTRDGL